MPVKEGFAAAGGAAAVPAAAAAAVPAAAAGAAVPAAGAPSPIQTQIRAILDPFTASPGLGEDLCNIFTLVRKRIYLNTQAEANSIAGNTSATGGAISDAELTKQVEKTLAIGIPGGALPCPLLTYPIPGSTDADWLDFLSKLPPDFIGRIILMAIYAKNTLGSQERTLKSTLAGVADQMNALSMPQNSESFTDICPPNVAETRRLSKLNAAATTSCLLPDEMSPAEIQASVTKLLQTLVANQNTTIQNIDTLNKQSVLKQLTTDPKKTPDTSMLTPLPFDLKATIAAALVSMKYLQEKEAAAKAGTLMPTPVA